MDGTGDTTTRIKKRLVAIVPFKCKNLENVKWLVTRLPTAP